MIFSEISYGLCILKPVAYGRKHYCWNEPILEPFSGIIQVSQCFLTKVSHTSELGVKLVLLVFRSARNDSINKYVFLNAFLNFIMTQTPIFRNESKFDCYIQTGIVRGCNPSRTFRMFWPCWELQYQYNRNCYAIGLLVLGEVSLA